MALADTYVKLAMNMSHAMVAAMPPAAQKNLVAHIWTGNTALRGFYPNDSHARTINGLGGSIGRMAQDNMSISVCASRPHEMPIFFLGGLNTQAISEMAQLIKKGLITATVINRGLTVGTAGSSWRVGFALTAEEIIQYTIYPRTVWTGIVAVGTEPAASADNFIYLPLTPHSSVQVQVADTTADGGSYTVTLYGFNSATGTVVTLEEFAASTDNSLYEIDVPQFSYILPVVTAHTAGLNLSISVGARIARLG